MDFLPAYVWWGGPGIPQLKKLGIFWKQNSKNQKKSGPFTFFWGKPKTGKPGNFREMAGKSREISWILGLANFVQKKMDFDQNFPELIPFKPRNQEISRIFPKFPKASCR